jgi:hypothetical protein
LNVGFIDPSTLAALVFGCGGVGERKRGTGRRNHRPKVDLYELRPSVRAAYAEPTLPDLDLPALALILPYVRVLVERVARQVLSMWM